MFDIIDGNIKEFFTSVYMANENIYKHLHSNFEILIVTGGTMHIQINEQEYIVPEGSGIFVPPFSAHSISNNTDYTICALMFTKETTPHFYEFLKSNTLETIVFSLNQASKNALNEFLPVNKNFNDNPFHAQAVLGPIICDIYDKCKFTENKVPMTDFLYRALDYMIEHSKEPLTREIVAKAIGIHPVTLSNCFSKNSYINFNSALNQMRCSQAAMMIRRDNKTITEIAYATGFGSIRSFNRAFMEVYKTTPNQFRKSQKQ